MYFHISAVSLRNGFSPGLLSPLLAFVQTWLDEYSEDFRDPPLHPALRLLLDHLRISSAVLDSMRSQPNFCSLAGQAEELLRKFQKEGDHLPCGRDSQQSKPHATPSWLFCNFTFQAPSVF